MSTYNAVIEAYSSVLPTFSENVEASNDVQLHAGEAKARL